MLALFPNYRVLNVAVWSRIGMTLLKPMGVFDINSTMMLIPLAEIKFFVKDLF